MARITLGLFVLVAVAVFAGTRPDAPPTPVHAAISTFNTTGTHQYQVPLGVTRVQIEAVGAAGGVGGDVACGQSQGGAGGYILATGVPVVGGTTLTVVVGGFGAAGTAGGAGGSNGGGQGGPIPVFITPRPNGGGAGGGGASDVRTSPGGLPNRILSAAGGGGGGGCGSPSIPPGPDNGGNGGFGAGTGQAGFNAQNPAIDAGKGGGGGQLATGGTAGGGDNSLLFPSTIGTSGQGGNGGGNDDAPAGGSGGGGGGGLFGGGGGGAGFGDNADGGGGGGGGGSNLQPVGATSIVNSNNLTGDPTPRVIITTLDFGPFTKAFSPASIQVNAASTLTFTLRNNSAAPLTGVSFTDDLAANGNAITITGAAVSTCGPTLVAAVGTSMISLSNATIPPGNCTISVPVTSATTGSKVNTSSLLTSNEAAAVGPAVNTLDVTAAPATPIPPTPIPPTPIPNTPIPNTPVPPTLTPTLVVLPVIPVIPQIFQRVPTGIFYGNHSTPTPIIRAAVAPSAPTTGPIAVMPVLRPPSTGDAGLQSSLGLPSVW